MLIIMCLFCGILKENRRLPGQPMSQGIIGMLVWEQHRKFMNKGCVLKNTVCSRQQM